MPKPKYKYTPENCPEHHLMLDRLTNDGFCKHCGLYKAFPMAGNVQQKTAILEGTDYTERKRRQSAMAGSGLK